MNKKMSKPKVDYKKQIIRNPEDCIPKVILVQQLPEPAKEQAQPEPCPENEKKSSTEPFCEIAIPKLNSTNCVKKKIKKVEQLRPRKIKSLSDLPQPERITIDEKITKKVNFPFDQRLYKELISLKLIGKPISPTVSIVAHETTTTRDHVPKLENFFIPDTKPEYYISAHTTPNPHVISRNSNGLRLYQIMKTWKSDRPA